MSESFIERCEDNSLKTTFKLDKWATSRREFR